MKWDPLLLGNYYQDTGEAHPVTQMKQLHDDMCIATEKAGAGHWSPEKMVNSHVAVTVQQTAVLPSAEWRQGPVVFRCLISDQKPPPKCLKQLLNGFVWWWCLVFELNAKLKYTKGFALKNSK